MPLDASIILGARPVELPDPVANAARFYGLLAAQTQAEEGQRTRAREDAKDAAYKSASAGGKFNRDVYLAKLGEGGLGSEALAAQSEFTKEDLTNAKTLADTNKAQRESALFNLDAGARLFGAVKDQAGYDAAQQQARAMGLDTASFGLGPVYDPAAVDRAVQSAISAKDRIDQHHKEQELAETTRAHKETERLTGRGQDMISATADKNRSAENARAAASRGVTIRGQDLEQGRFAATHDLTRIEAEAAAKSRGGLTGFAGAAGDALGLKPKSIPAETMAKLSLGRNYASQAPDIKSFISGSKNGELQAGVATNIGKAGIATARQSSGVDALLRGLTGAGMPEQEAQRYAQRYSFQITDSKSRMLEKVDQLNAELKAIDNGISGQYGQAPSNAYGGAVTPRNLATSAPLPASGNRTPLPGKGRAGAVPVSGHAGWSVTVK